MGSITARIAKTCYYCAGTGVNNYKALDATCAPSGDTPEMIPAELYLAEGIACLCEAGVWFAAQQMEFFKEPQGKAAETQKRTGMQLCR